MAKRLSALLRTKYYDLDDFYWLPNWVKKEEAQFQKDIDEQILSQPKWVVAGNYGGVLFEHADTIVWLNYSLPRILYRYFTRTTYRIVFREEVCNGNYETLSTSFFQFAPEKNLFLWILKTYGERKSRFGELRETELSHKRWIELRNQNEADELIFSLQAN